MNLQYDIVVGTLHRLGEVLTATTKVQAERYRYDMLDFVLVGLGPYHGQNIWPVPLPYHTRPPPRKSFKLMNFNQKTMIG